MRAGQDRRQTPPEIRAFWRLANTAVSNTIITTPEAMKSLALKVSWALYRAMIEATEAERQVFEKLLQEGRDLQQVGRSAFGPMPKPRVLRGRRLKEATK